MIVKIDETEFEKALIDIDAQIEEFCEDEEGAYMILHAAKNAYEKAKRAAQKEEE